MESGKITRLGRLIDPNSNKTFIVAMDHEVFLGAVKGLEDPVAHIRLLSEVKGVTGFTLGPKQFQIAADIVKGRKGLVMRIDGPASHNSLNPYRTNLIRSVRAALSMGADAVVAMGYVGEENGGSLRNLALLAEECENFGVPLIAEMIPIKGSGISDPYDAEVVSNAARIGAELGADLIKTHYTGSKESFKIVVKSCPVPVAILGGPRTDVENLLETVRGAMEAGSIGVIFGRNIWQHANPKLAAESIAGIVHRTST